MIESLASKWQRVVKSVVIKHIDPTCTPLLLVSDDPIPTLHVRVRNCRDTNDQDRRVDLAISNVKLMYWPGEVVARKWLAASWAGYIQHEALELVFGTDGSRVLNPHDNPSWDIGLRRGYPERLTPGALVETLALVMTPDEVKICSGC